MFDFLKCNYDRFYSLIVDYEIPTFAVVFITKFFFLDRSWQNYFTMGTIFLITTVLMLF